MSMKALIGGSHWNEKKLKTSGSPPPLSPIQMHTYVASLLICIKIIISQSKSLPPDLSNLLSKTSSLDYYLSTLYRHKMMCIYLLLNEKKCYITHEI